MNESQIIGKLESARRHIDSGIEMFFEKKDSLVIYSVGFTAYNMLSELCHQKKIHRPLEDDPIIAQLGLVKEVANAFRKPRNFLQHGQRGEATVKFFPNMAFLILLSAGVLYEKLGGTRTVAMAVLTIWFSLKYPSRSGDKVGELASQLTGVTGPEDFEFFADFIRNGASNAK
jgi:hypothetical protein